VLCWRKRVRYCPHEVSEAKTWTELHPAIAPRPSLTEWARAWAFAQVGHRDDTVASNRRVPHVSGAYKQPLRGGHPCRLLCIDRGSSDSAAGPTSGSRHQTVSVRLGPMGVKDRLHKLVDQLDDDAAQRLLAAAETLVPAPRPSDQDELPAFVGSFASGHVDVSTRAEDILRDELGEHRSP
jgi:hypothetical protein